LHNLWSELPNYNPVGVTNSGPGQDFAAKAAAVFSKRSGETDSSGVEDNYPNPDEEDDQTPHDADASNRDSSEFDESGGWLGRKPKDSEEKDLDGVVREESKKTQPNLNLKKATLRDVRLIQVR
jgi:hypothetical protein